MAGICQGLDALPPEAFEVADAWELEACSILMSTDRHSGACAPVPESLGFGGSHDGSESEVCLPCESC